jgi:hypothetical protein
MATLRSFFNHFATVADPCTTPLWRYEEFETPDGVRREMHFVGQAASITEIGNRLEFEAVDTQEYRVYKHAGHLMEMLAEYYLDYFSYVVVHIYGHAFQAFLSVNKVKVEPYNDHAIEVGDSFGNFSAEQVQNIKTVRLLRHPEKRHHT